jgi:hypothetical protein
MARQNIRLVLIDLHQNNITHMYNAITIINDNYFQEQITGISIISNKLETKKNVPQQKPNIKY